MPRELIVSAGPKGMVIILSPGGRHTVCGCTLTIQAHPKVKGHPKNAKAQVTARSLQSPEYHGQVLSQYRSLILTLCWAPSHQRKFSSGPSVATRPVKNIKFRHKDTRRDGVWPDSPEVRVIQVKLELEFWSVFSALLPFWDCQQPAINDMASNTSRHPLRC